MRAIVVEEPVAPGRRQCRCSGRCSSQSGSFSHQKYPYAECLESLVNTLSQSIQSVPSVLSHPLLSTVSCHTLPYATLTLACIVTQANKTAKQLELALHSVTDSKTVHFVSFQGNQDCGRLSWRLSTYHLIHLYHCHQHLHWFTKSTAPK